MRFKVLLTGQALLDMDDIIGYVRSNDSPAAAAALATHFEKVLGLLESFPQRGNVVKELASLGIKDFRESLYKPYRFIYRVTQKFVYVNLIADGRRDMQSLLSRRILGSF